MESFAIKKRQKLLVIAGPNGSGKTSVTNQILKHSWRENCEYINPDIIAQEKFGDWNSNDAVIKAAIFSQELRYNLLESNSGIVFETVLSSEEKLLFIKKAKEKEYFIRVFFIGTNSPEINAGRIAKRVIEGGHDVPIHKIISRYKKSIVNCVVIAPIVDRLYVYDNSIENEKAKLLFRASNGILTKQYCEINDWAKIIYNQFI
jgi:predicted ABC-type ATPase